MIDSSNAGSVPGRQISARASTLWIYALAGLCLMMVVVSLLSRQQWRSQKQQLATVLESSDLLDTNTDLAARLESEASPHHAQLLVARSLVYDCLRRSVNATDEERQQLAARLPQARELAADALLQQPNSWQAAMLIGTSTYLEWSLLEDRRLFTEASSWEKPLLQAVADASGHPEPRRLLVTAYLEVWHALSPAKRAEGRKLLAQVFRDDTRAMEALMPAWLAIRQPREEAYEVIPPDPDAWRVLVNGHAQQHQWRAFGASYERYLSALETDLTAKRDEAEKRLALGERRISRAQMLAVVMQAPPSMRFAPLVDRALTTYPPGLHGLKATTTLRAWLDWALELSVLGLRPLSPRALIRLLDSIDDVESHLAAHTAQVAGDSYLAARYERLTDSLKLKDWAPYVIAKADSLLDAGKDREAYDVLAQMSLGQREELPYLVQRLRVMRAVGSLGEVQEAEQQLNAVTATQWTAFHWRRSERRQKLLMLPATSAAGIEIRIAAAPAEGTVVEVRWNGEAVSLQTVRVDDWLRVDVEVVAGQLQLLEIYDVASGRDLIVPADVRLLN